MRYINPRFTYLLTYLPRGVLLLLVLFLFVEEYGSAEYNTGTLIGSHA